MRSIVAFALVLLACTAAPAFAYGPAGPAAPSVDFGVHGNFSLSNLPGPVVSGNKALENVYGPGIGGGVHVDIGVPMIALRVSGDYEKFAVDESRFRDAYRGVFGGAVSQIGITGGDLKITSLTANIRSHVMPLPFVSPYVTAGAGVAWLSMDAVETSIAGVAGQAFGKSTADGRTVLQGGAGVDFNFKIKLYAEVRYVSIDTPGGRSSYVPATIGVTF